MVEANSNTPEYSVSELSAVLKRAVEDRFGHVRVRGEISGLKVAASGHVYLTLKDDGALLDAVMWKGTASTLRFRPSDGLEVVAQGRLTTYPARSRYQLVIERLEPAGAGALMALLEARKKQLAAEGLFDTARKRPLPVLPRVIGVVTSPTGAVIRDILHRLDERFPCHVLVWPVLVQGEGAAAQIAAAIQGFNAMPVPPDLLIVARGGGSIEDLWAFNEEVVVRAAAASRIPLISAVGHETDTTLIDFASDHRAPTPTAAAERAVPVRTQLLEQVEALSLRHTRASRRLLGEKQEALRSASRALPHPRSRLELAQQRLDDVSGRLPRALQTRVLHSAQRSASLFARLSPLLLRQRIAAESRRLDETFARLGRVDALQLRRQRVDSLSRLLETLSPYATLHRGYAVVRAAAGAVITSSGAAQAARQMNIIFHDGDVAVTTQPSARDGQGQLF